MMKILRLGLLAASVAFVAAGPAAAGGMGDASAHIREMNAICDMQRRGQAPPSPNMCLPEYPPGVVADPHPRRGD